MLDPLSRIYVQGRSAREWATVANVFAGLAGVVSGLVAPFLFALFSGNARVAAGWAFCSFVLGVLALLLVEKPPAHLEPTTTFTPFQPDPASRWDREDDLHQFDDFVASSRSVAIVVGASGSGKTVLLHTLLRDRLEDRGYGYRYFNTYPIAGGALERGIEEAAKGERCGVVVLDQFEQFLAWMSRATSPSPGEESTRLLDLIDKWAPGEAKFVIAVRQEWFLELRWLGARLPSLWECIEVDPPKAKEIGGSLRLAFGGIGDGFTAAPIVEELERDHAGRIWPLEAQIVGAALERAEKARHATPDIDLLRSLGGVPGAINSYFTGILDAAKDRRVALKVLCALSAHTRFRERIHEDKVVEILFERASDVTKAITFLKEQELVVDRGAENYELSHDYVAEFFHQKGGWELDPIEHDNILFHVEELVRPRLASQSDAGPRARDVVKSTADRASAGPLSLATGLLVPLAIWMLVRLLTPNVHWAIDSLGPVEHPVFGGHVDETYAPIFIGQIAWAAYVGVFYHRVFRHLTAGYLWSGATVVGVAIAAVAAMFIPGVWLLSIAFCGLLVGLALIRISFVPLNEIARKRLRITGAITIANMIFLGLLGGTGLAITIIAVQAGSRLNDWIAASAALSAAMFTAAVALRPAHVSRPAVAQTLGLLARPAKPVIPRMGAMYLPGDVASPAEASVRTETA